jgi:predicted methyltransferase MtxX (methanogen marker protein 4)
MLNTEDTEKILILSGDKDFAQLAKYANVSQYDPVRKRWIRHNDPEAFLVDHLIDGDVGDGIPNILSADNVLVEKIRQSPVTKKKRAMITESIKSGQMDSEIRGRYERNKQLIDLDYIPEDIRKSILKLNCCKS